MRKIVSRPFPNEIPSLPLPFHVRSAGYNEAPAGWSERVPGEDKRFMQIFWTTDGRGEFVRPGGSVSTGPGEVFYRRPLEEHFHRSLTAGRELWRYYWFTIDGGGAEALFDAYGYPDRPWYAGEAPVELFHELEIQLWERTPYAQRHALAVALELLARLGGTRIAAADSDLVRRFIELAHERFADPECSVQLLAAELRVHRTTLNRIFHRKTAVYPGDYLGQLRIQHAMSLLRETTLPLKEVAFRCGLSHVSYFCRMIRERTGMTPSDYRRNSGVN